MLPTTQRVARRRPTTTLALAAAALFAGSAAGTAQNLLVNPNFDLGLGGWQVLGPATWDGTLDAGGAAPTSGSAKGVTTQPGGIDAIVAQCVPLDIGTTYHFGGKIFIPSGNTADGGAFFILIPFPQADCQGPPPPGGFLQTGDVTTVGAWIDSEVSFTNTFALSGQIWAAIAPQTTGSFQANFDDTVVAPGALPCPSDVQGSLCLVLSRFTVSAGFNFANGDLGFAHAVPLGDGNSSGYYWFFDAGNLEVLVKLIDGCAVNGHFWFFAAGLTNLEVKILVMDAKTGAMKTYTNPANTAFTPIQDTVAFACP